MSDLAIGAGKAPEARVQRLLDLIGQTHVEHDARIAVSTAIYQAEVVILDRGDRALAARVAQHLGSCNGRIVTAIGPATRFAVRATRAAAADVDEARSRGVLVIDEAELERMLEIYASHTSEQQQQVHTAVRRARSANQGGPLSRLPAPAPPAAREPERRMATSPGNEKRPGPEVQPLSDDLQELERHARDVRRLSTSASFRAQRKPFAQPR